MSDTQRLQMVEEADRYRALAATARNLMTRCPTRDAGERMKQISERYERFAREAAEASAAGVR